MQHQSRGGPFVLFRPGRGKTYLTSSCRTGVSATRPSAGACLAAATWTAQKYIRKKMGPAAEMTFPPTLPRLSSTRQPSTTWAGATYKKLYRRHQKEMGFGLAAFLIQQRTREIGIRKVLGARLGHLRFSQASFLTTGEKHLLDRLIPVLLSHVLCFCSPVKIPKSGLGARTVVRNFAVAPISRIHGRTTYRTGHRSYGRGIAR